MPTSSRQARAFARLKQKKTFGKARSSPSRISQAVAAVHTTEIALRSG
ncbi:hypothetical protein [Streptomyces violascens]